MKQTLHAPRAAALPLIAPAAGNLMPAMNYINKGNIVPPVVLSIYISQQSAFPKQSRLSPSSRLTNPRQGIR